MDKIDLLYRCKRIRAVEEGIAARYSEQEMRCPTHLSIGQELVGAALGIFLNPDDLAVSSHRAHAHYLGKGGDLKSMLAEIYGKETGCSKGRGGSMHLIDRAMGFEGCTAIVGNSVPVGVGLGLSIQLDGDKNRIACVFIGDAVMETGSLYESLNFAATRDLPVLFVCENNLYSVYSPLSVRQPKKRSIIETPKALQIHSTYADGADAINTHDALKDAVSYVRENQKPAFIEISTYRWREHCGPNYDNDIGYRSEEEYQAWRDKDAICALEKELLDQDILSSESLAEMEQKIQKEVDEAFEFAKSSPFPDASTAGDYQYAQEIIKI